MRSIQSGFAIFSASSCAMAAGALRIVLASRKQGSAKSPIFLSCGISMSASISGPAMPEACAIKSAMSFLKSMPTLR